MSIRINLNTFNLYKLQALFGSGGRSVIEAVDEKLLYLEDSHILKPKDYRAASKALEGSIHQGIPIAGLTNEGYGHVELANLLAEYQQRHYGLDCDYKYFGVEAFWKEYRNKVEQAGQSLFDVLLKGRPLFGKTISSRLEVRYGYLTNKEAQSLSARLRMLVHQHSTNRDVAEIAGGYLQCLQGICRGKRDVWISVS